MKKLVSYVLIVLMLLSFVGCNGNEENGNSVIDEIQSKKSVQKVEEYEFTANSLQDYKAYNIMFKSNELNICSYLSMPESYSELGCPTIIYLPGSMPSHENSAQKFTMFGAITFTMVMRGSEPSEGQKDLGDDDYNDTKILYDIVQNLSFVDTDNLYVIASSEQSINALKLCADYDNIKGLVLDSPIVDLAKLYDSSPDMMKGYFDEILGGSPEDIPQEYADRSAINFVDKIKCPVLAMDYELGGVTAVTSRLTKDFINKLKKQGVKAEFKFIEEPGADYSGQALIEAIEFIGL